MEFQIVNWVVTGLMGVVMYFMRQNSQNTKEELKALKDSVEKVKDTYYKKEDFKEFKEDLWVRLDKFEKYVSDKLEHK